MTDHLKLNRKDIERELKGRKCVREEKNSQKPCMYKWLTLCESKHAFGVKNKIKTQLSNATQLAASPEKKNKKKTT